MPPNPPTKAHGFAMRMHVASRHANSQIGKKKLLAPPLPNPGDAPEYRYDIAAH